MNKEKLHPSLVEKEDKKRITVGAITLLSMIAIVIVLVLALVLPIKTTTKEYNYFRLVPTENSDYYTCYYNDGGIDEAEVKVKKDDVKITLVLDPMQKNKGKLTIITEQMAFGNTKVKTYVEFWR